MYKNLGYIVYRTVIDYYAGYDNADEDAYGKYECKRISKTRFKTHFNLKSFIWPFVCLFYELQIWGKQCPGMLIRSQWYR